MTTVTLSWEDPEDARVFRSIRADLRRDGWASDMAVAALVELVKDSTEEGDDDRPPDHR